MEPVVYEETPLADYLKDGGDGSERDWARADGSPRRPSSSRSVSPSSSPLPPSPLPFAPTGRPLVRARFRGKAAATDAVPGASRQAGPRSMMLRAVRRNCSAALAASLDRADNAKFLEQFRYTIIASQLLSGHSMPGHRSTDPSPAAPADAYKGGSILSTQGVVAPVVGALAVAVLLSWLLSSMQSPMTRRRVVLVLLVLAASAFVGHVYMRRQWLRYRREQSVSEIASFVSNSCDFDGATEATLSLVQEVELVSRGYRISAPLPPASRLEDRSQSRKCVRLRRALKTSVGGALAAYNQAASAVRGFSEQTELERYYDMYDISDLDMSDALKGFSKAEFDDDESLRTLKMLAARLYTARKMLLCALLALNASGEGADLLRWSTAAEALQSANAATKAACDTVQAILRDEESFPAPPTPKTPLTPGRERWRSQLRKLSSLSTGIRGLQAKFHLLREESDRALDDSNDMSELVSGLMAQYESIGGDLRDLVAAWEEGKAALSPAASLSGLATAGDGGNGAAADALKALTSESPPSSEAPEPPDTPDVFEAVALPRPRPRSLLTRDERIARARDLKAQARQHVDATRGMLRELETVISLRPRSRASAPPSKHIVLM